MAKEDVIEMQGTVLTLYQTLCSVLNLKTVTL